MMTRLFRAALCAAVVIAGTHAGAQSAPPQNPPAGPPAPSQTTFRSRIDSVSVDVTVTDKQGRPVTDLTADDFEVRENKQVQKVEQFKLIQVDAQPDAPAPDILTPEAHAREIAREDVRMLVVFLDDYHVRKSNSQRIRQQVAFFVSQLSTRDLVAVMYPLTPPSALTFTYDHDAIAGAIANFEGRKYDYSPRNAIEAQYQMYTPEQQEQIRNSTVIDSLSNASAYLGTLREGRKAVLFVSEGMSSMLAAGVTTTGTVLGGNNARTPMSQAVFSSTQLQSDLTRIFQAAARSNTSIYTLDPRGLGDSEFGVADRVNPELGRQMLNESTDILRVIANETDGRAIVNRNDPLPALRQMLSDTGTYYLLGYTTAAPRDGKFHDIQVRVKRSNVDVHARKGYWARSEDEAAKAAAPAKPEPAKDLAAALETLTDEASNRSPVRVWMGASPGAGDKAVVTLAWETTADTQPADAMDAVDRINITATSIYGDQLFKGLVPRDPQGARPSGVVTFPAPAGGVTVRVVAENARGLRLDTSDASFEVPDLAGTGLLIAPPFVYRGRTVRDLQQLRAAAAPMPAVTRSFSRTERLLLRFQVRVPGGATPVMTMRLLNQQGSSMVDLPAPTAIPEGRYEAELGLAALPPGNYLVEINAEAAGAKSRTLLAIRVKGS